MNSCNEWLSIPRFFSNYIASGLGFQLEYESTNVSHWTYNSGACGGNFTTANGALTSPSYPSRYPDFADCIYTISQPTGTVIVLKLLSMDIGEYPKWCLFAFGRGNIPVGDYLEVKDGPSAGSPLLDYFCGKEIPAPIQSSQSNLWMK